MTQYFDHQANQLEQAKRQEDLTQLTKALDLLDSSLVWDVSLCSEFEGFPDDLRERVNQIVLKYSAAAQPVNASGPSYETPAEHINGILSMVAELHTLFHELAERRLAGFSDDPRTPLRIMYSRAEEKREALV